MEAIRFDKFGPLHAGGLEIRHGGVDEAGVGLFTTLERKVGDAIGFYAGVVKTHVTEREQEYAIELPGFDLVVVPPVDAQGNVDFENYPFAAANEPPQGCEANMVLVADRVYELNDKTYTVLAFYISRNVQANEELSWAYGPLYKRNYEAGNPCAAEFDITMSLPRLTRLLTHRPDAIFDVTELEKM
jgi:hypothetical protein